MTPDHRHRPQSRCLNCGRRCKGRLCRACFWNPGWDQRPPDVLVARVLARTILVGDCWEAQYSQRGGYPRLQVKTTEGRRHWTAARVMLMWKLGRPIGAGKMTCHTCDNRACVNPAHLYEGSAADNQRDAVARNPVLVAMFQAMRDAAAKARAER